MLIILQNSMIKEHKLTLGSDLQWNFRKFRKEPTMGQGHRDTSTCIHSPVCTDLEQTIKNQGQ